MERILLLILLLSLPTVTHAVSCGGLYDSSGFTDLIHDDQKLENKNARGYVVRESLYTFHCCGVITSWEIRAGYTGAIELMVWQSMGGDNERLVGKNVRVIASVNPPGGEELGELLTFNIPEAEQIIVEPGYRIGWYCSDLDILVAYAKGGASFDNNYYMEDMTNTNVGETVTLEKQDNDRTFAIKAYTAQGSVPTLSGLPTDVTIASDLPQGSTLYVPVVVNTNSYDTFTFSETGVVSIYFAVDSVTGAVTVASSTTIVPGTYTVDITVTNRCLLSSTTTLTVNVQNQSPVLQGLPTTISIHEDTTGETTLHGYQITDVEGDSVACSLPIDSPFYIKKEAASDYVCYKGSPGLSHTNQSSYTLTAHCTDGYNTINSTVVILVLQNQSPVITNLPGAVTVSAKLTATSVTVFSVSASDPDDNITTVSMTCSACPFIMYPDGRIVTTKSLEDEKVGSYMLSVSVADSRNTVGPALLTIVLTDHNSAPSFSNLPKTLFVPETAIPGSRLYQLSFSDPDVNDTPTVSVHTLLPTSGGILFGFNFSDTSVYLLSSATLDYEYLTDHNFTIVYVVTDGITSSTSSLEILILDENEAPSFSSTTYYISTPEADPGTDLPFVSMVVSDPDAGDSYIYDIDGGIDAGYFAINQSTGALSFAAAYDIIPAESPKTTDLIVKATDSGGLTGTATVSITVAYINKSPSFTNIPQTIQVSESEISGSQLYVISTSDPDGDSVQVSMTTDTTLTSSIITFNQTLNTVFLSTKFDYETTTVHNLTFVAFDGTTQSGYSSLILQVTDHNEAPVFLQTSYHKTVSEAQTGGLVFPGASFTISDEDIGDTHTYSIDSGTEAASFAIHQSTGDISFALDYDVTPLESPKTTVLVIKATDSGYLSGTTTLHLTITHINKPPYFSNIPQTIQVSESELSGSQLYVISTSDPDGDSVQVSMTTDTTVTSSIITFNQTLNTVFLSTKFDYETTTVHNLTFVAFDGTTQSGYSSLILQVTDHNEAPVFLQTSYQKTVSEAQTGGLVFPGATFTISDEDIGDTHTYSIDSGTEAASFSIHQSTGNISFAVDYDVTPLESPKTTVLVIKATDSGYLSGTTTLHLTITHINKPPYFSNLPQTATISEDSNLGHIIYVISVVDPDMDNVSVSMTTDGLLTSSKVSYDDSNRSLMVLSSFDYETCTTHIVTFMAFDGTEYSAAANLTITISNANESPEVAQATYYLSTVEGSINDALALPVPLYPATDPDGDSPLTYSLVSNNHSSYFYINASSGVLYYTVDFICSLLSPDVAQLITRVSDPNGGYTDTNLHIAISHTNTKPQALNLPANITFPESLETGGFIYAVNLYDPDGETMTCTFQYSPSSSHSKFSISQSGSSLSITLSERFDFEITPVYWIYVTISDGIEASETYKLRIDVLDVNEPPSFLQSVYDITTQESQNGTLINAAIAVTDEDTGDSLTVSIKDGNDLSRFYLDQTCKLFFNVDYDVDDAAFPVMVNLTLEVTDSGFLSNTAVVRLTISDTNDNRPTFGSTQYVHSTSDAVVGSTVLTVSASDLDSGLNGECVYQLNNSGSNPYRDAFAISESGSILLMQSIDSYASDHVFIFDVIVTDKGLPPLSSTSQVSLIIQQEVVNQPAAASAQVSEQEVDVASVLTSPGMLGMIAAIVTGFILVAIGNAICWLRSKSKVPGKESPTPELTRLEKSDADVPKKPMNKTKKDPDPIRKANKPTRSSSIDPQIEDYSCWNEVRGKSKLRVSTSDPGSTIPRVEVLTPLDTPSHLSVSRTASITQYVSHMSGKKSIDFF